METSVFGSQVILPWHGAVRVSALQYGRLAVVNEVLLVPDTMGWKAEVQTDVYKCICELVALLIYVKLEIYMLKLFVGCCTYNVIVLYYIVRANGVLACGNNW